MAGSQFFFPNRTYVERRQGLMDSVKGSKMLLLGNSYSPMNYKDNHYPFRQDSTFLYYIGINLPDLCAVIDSEAGITTLYGDDLTLDMIIWTGNQPSLSELGAQCGITEVKKMSSLKADLNAEVKYLPPYRGEHTLQLQDLLDGQDIVPSMDLIMAIIAQRNIKSEEEIAELDKAVGITARMHTHIMQHAQAGIKEYELVGVANAFAWKHNCQFAFPPICTINGQTLHNHYHGNTLSDGDMLLMDSGVQVESGYCGDMTRTYPVSGKYSSLQASLYTIVNAAHDHAASISKPGVYNRDVHLAAAKVITEGLIAMGWMHGDPDAAVAAGAHTLFFQHGLGHMMGLDVHDMENLGEINVGYDETIQKSTEFGLKSLRLGRQLREGNVITIEPGLYVIPELIDKFQSENKFSEYINYSEVNKYRDAGGIRIENDYVVRAHGVAALGSPDGTSVTETESLMNQNT